MTEASSKPATFLVQCCHLPQLLFVGTLLREKQPEQPLVLLALRHPDLDDLLAQCNPFDAICFLGELELADGDLTNRILFPLFHRGYRRAKLAAWRLPGIKQSIDLSTRCFELTRWELERSCFLPRGAGFSEGFERFAQRLERPPLRGKIVLFKSCSQGLFSRSRSKLKALIDDQARLTRVDLDTPGLSRSWLQRQRFDAGIVYWTGEKGFARLKLHALFLRLPRLVVFNENGDSCLWTTRSAVRFFLTRLFRGISYGRPRRVAVYQTEGVEYMRLLLEKMRRSSDFSGSETLLVCRWQDRARLQGAFPFKAVVSFPRRFAELFSFLRALRRFAPELGCALFSGRAVFRKAKLLFFLTGGRRLRAYNAGLEHYRLTLRTLPRTRRHDVLLIEEPPRRVAVYQTEGVEYMRLMLEKMSRSSDFSGTETLLVCRWQDRAKLQGAFPFKAVVPFPRRFAELFSFLRALRRFTPQLSCALFSGRAVFRNAKLLFFLTGGRRLRAYNAGLDHYRLTLRTLPRIRRHDVLLVDDLRLADLNRAEVLVIQTESEKLTAGALEVILHPKVVPGGKITLLCRPGSRKTFARLRAVDEVLPYPESTAQRLRTVLRLLRRRFDVAAALFSGRPIFIPHKLLYFILRARHRLVINENLDCYWLKWRTYSLFLSPRRSLAQAMPIFNTEVSLGWIRASLKLVLFAPRYLYLVIWVTFHRLRRSYARRPEE